MGAQNVAPIFGSIMKILKDEWQAKENAHHSMYCVVKVIMENIMLRGLLFNIIIKEFEVVLSVLGHYCKTLNKKGCTFLIPDQ